MASDDSHIGEALRILVLLGLPRAQQNERSALCLLALLNLTPERTWPEAGSPLIGITPIMDWAREYYGKAYAPNTRETIRRQSLNQFVAAGIALYNPDEPLRAVNSPKAVYQIAPAALALLRSYGSLDWETHLAGLPDREPDACREIRAGARAQSGPCRAPLRRQDHPQSRRA